MAERETRPTPERVGTVPVYDRGWAPLWRLRNDIEDVFDDFLSTGWSGWGPRRGQGAGPSTRPPAALPTLDVIDKDAEVKLVADLPGLAEDDIDVEVTDSTLTIAGEKKEELEEGDKEGARYVSERRFGRFMRRIPLPDGIDADNIDASFRNGVLTVRLPKKPEAQNPARKIRVRAEA